MRSALVGVGRCGQGFSLIEIIVSLIILAFLGLAGAESIQAILQGYNMARSSDEIAQKAQMALNRMTIELGYVNPTDTVSNSGTSTSLTYTALFPAGSEAHTISISGNQILYAVAGTDYVLLDNVAAGGLTFSYYTGYNDTTPASTMSASTKLIGVSIVMHGQGWKSGVTKAFSTRVFLNKF